MERPTTLFVANCYALKRTLMAHDTPTIPNILPLRTQCLHLTPHMLSKRWQARGGSLQIMDRGRRKQPMDLPSLLMRNV